MGPRYIEDMCYYTLGNIGSSRSLFANSILEIIVLMNIYDMYHWKSYDANFDGIDGRLDDNRRHHWQ